ncbi:hypothetical protein MTR67_019836, partial [Solanum verrucosum]
MLTFPKCNMHQRLSTLKKVSALWLVVLLSSASWMLSSAYDFPLPGHILIHGPSVSSFFLVPFDVSVHAATARFLSSDLAVGSQGKPVLFKDDFLRAMHEFIPVAMRDITKPAADGGRSGWEDVG